MHGYSVSEKDWRGSDKPVGKYLVCVGGYPIMKLPSFSAAVEAAQAKISNWLGPEDDFSIYQIDTGIHFDIPCDPRFDDGFPHRTSGLIAVLNTSSDVSAYLDEQAGNPIDRAVGGAIRFRRLQLKMRSAQVAKAANIEDSVFDDYEAGRTRVQAEHLRQIAKTLNVPIGDFFGPPVAGY
jgi:hypothetical protein